jgi:hypothetical protein
LRALLQRRHFLLRMLRNARPANELINRRHPSVAPPGPKAQFNRARTHSRKRNSAVRLP